MAVKPKAKPKAKARPKKSAPPRKPVAAGPDKVAPTHPAPAAVTLSYAKAGVTADWRNVRVVDLKTGKVIPDVYEANAVAGWADQAIRDAAGAVQGRNGQIVCRRLHRSIRIERLM